MHKLLIQLDNVIPNILTEPELIPTESVNEIEGLCRQVFTEGIDGLDELLIKYNSPLLDIIAETASSQIALRQRGSDEPAFASLIAVPLAVTSFGEQQQLDQDFLLGLTGILRQNNCLDDDESIVLRSELLTFDDVTNNCYEQFKHLQELLPVFLEDEHEPKLSPLNQTEKLTDEPTVAVRFLIGIILTTKELSEKVNLWEDDDQDGLRLQQMTHELNDFCDLYDYEFNPCLLAYPRGFSEAKSLAFRQHLALIVINMIEHTAQLMPGLMSVTLVLDGNEDLGTIKVLTEVDDERVMIHDFDLIDELSNYYNALDLIDQLKSEIGLVELDDDSAIEAIKIVYRGDYL